MVVSASRTGGFRPTGRAVSPRRNNQFNEAEVLSRSDAPEPEITEVITSSYKRSKHKDKREADLDGLPAVYLNTNY